MSESLLPLEAPVKDEPPPRVVPVRRTGQWASAAVVAFLAVFAVQSLATNDAMQWDVVGAYFTSKSIVRGLYMTLWLTGLTFVLGFLLGTVLAICRMSGNAVLRGAALGYIWLFRSTPLLVQLLVWFNIGALYPKLGLGIPWGPTFVQVDAKDLIGATTAAIIGLTVHEAALAAEIVRGGILGVDAGQTQAAQALGLSRFRTLRRIVLPQAMRTILPNAGNQIVSLLKSTTLVSVIGVGDVLYSAELIYGRNFLIIPLLLVATLWYLVVASLLSVGQFALERHYGRGSDERRPRRRTPHERRSLDPRPARLLRRDARAARRGPGGGGG
ncbi:ABC transporter permease subunit [Actinomadura rayongensis]|uniref:ABC transporter permease subunit n=1 Tax=Actinomadura rayongensis TaxID=1429076 RepID=A0A6I4WK06_9ACTN|nr:ABC transporter permease subunit [Actinomadura rayongensis]